MEQCQQKQMTLDANHRFFVRKVVMAVVKLTVASMIFFAVEFLSVSISMDLSSDNQNALISVLLGALSLVWLIGYIFYIVWQANLLWRLHKKVTAVENDEIPYETISYQENEAKNRRH
jgi:hypothetical protein